MSGPSLAELRAAGQPESVTARRNEEHWAGRFYMRRLSPYGTWVFARLGWSPNAVTWLMIVVGVAAGVVLAVPGFGAAVAAAALVQVYLLLDCSDGELARWSQRTSVTGVYLDRVGHYLAEAALLAGLGVRAQGHFGLAGGYASAGLAAAVCAVLVKAETDNVIVARAKAEPAPGGPGQAQAAPSPAAPSPAARGAHPYVTVGGAGPGMTAGGAQADAARHGPDQGAGHGPGPGSGHRLDQGAGHGPGPGGDAALEPRGAGLAAARRVTAALRVHRIIQAVELSLLAVVAAAADAVRGGLTATRVLVAACLIVGAVMVVAHLAAIVTSRRLG